MNIITVTHESQVKHPHIYFVDESPEGAAITISNRFGVEVDTVYQQGRRVYVPITWSVEQHWDALSNGV